MNTIDQPTIFPNNVTVGFSDMNDGTMSLKSLPHDTKSVWNNRSRFIDSLGGSVANTALVYVTYETQDFCRYRFADKQDNGLATDQAAALDGLVARQSQQGLFLPLADCCGVVLYDPATTSLMLSHIGRQAVEQLAGTKSVEYMVNTLGVQPSDLLVWLSPAVGSDSYPITKRGGQDLRRLIVDDLVASGVHVKNIETAISDMATNPDYFSHSEFIKDNRQTDGRQAVFAMLQ